MSAASRSFYLFHNHLGRDTCWPGVLKESLDVNRPMPPLPSPVPATKLAVEPPGLMHQPVDPNESCQFKLTPCKESLP